MHYVIDPTTFEIGFEANPPVAKDVISAKNILNLTGRINRGLNRGLDILTEGKDVHLAKDPNLFLQRWVAYMSVGSLVGLEVETNLTVIKSFADFTSDVTNNVGIFLSTPKSLHK